METKINEQQEATVQSTIEQGKKSKITALEMNTIYNSKVAFTEEFRRYIDKQDLSREKIADEFFPLIQHKDQITKLCKHKKRKKLNEDDYLANSKKTSERFINIETLILLRLRYRISIDELIDMELKKLQEQQKLGH